MGNFALINYLENQLVKKKNVNRFVIQIQLKQFIHIKPEKF